MFITEITLDAGLLARRQYSEGPATGHLDTGFSWFPCVYKQMLRWFPTFQVATTCSSPSRPDLNLVVTNFMFCLHVKLLLPPGNNPIAVNKYIILYFIILYYKLGTRSEFWIEKSIGYQVSKQPAVLTFCFPV